MPALYLGRSSRANVITEFLSTLPRALAMARSIHDLENLMVVVDRRVEPVEEIHSGAEDVRAYIAADIRKLLAVREFSTHLPGYLRPDQANQARVSILLERLKKILAF